MSNGLFCLSPLPIPPTISHFPLPREPPPPFKPLCADVLSQPLLVPKNERIVLCDIRTGCSIQRASACVCVRCMLVLAGGEVQNWICMVLIYNLTWVWDVGVGLEIVPDCLAAAFDHAGHGRLGVRIVLNLLLEDRIVADVVVLDEEEVVDGAAVVSFVAGREGGGIEVISVEEVLVGLLVGWPDDGVKVARGVLPHSAFCRA